MAPHGKCERCREWVSLELDAALSEFEAAVLRRHLRTCADCRAFNRDLHAFTGALRSVSASAPPVALPAPVHRRGVTAQRLSVGAAAAVAAIAAVFGSGLGGDQRGASVNAAGLLSTRNVDLVSMRGARFAGLHLPATTLRDVRVRVVELD